MELYFAPMEGITDRVFRRLHQRFYGGVARYYIPFFSPTQHHRLTPRECRELAPVPGLPAAPQVLTKNAQDFLWASQALADLGYAEINLNLGCPSGTVVPKGKGAGFLAWPDRLAAFLDEIFRASPLPISIKTRLGLRDPAEFAQILALYRRYPLRELIVHPRTASQMYQGALHLDAYRACLAQLTCPVCLNGELRSPAQLRDLETGPDAPAAAMLGRGLLANPALALQYRGGAVPPGTKAAFFAALSQEYLALFGNERNTLMRMKSLCSYWFQPEQEALWRQLRKCSQWPEFYALASAALTDAGA